MEELENEFDRKKEELERCIKKSEKKCSSLAENNLSSESEVSIQTCNDKI